jgi:hypothetical protein
MRALLPFALALLAPCASAQSMPYADADNPSQAVGMMTANALTSTRFLAECSSRFPALRPEMQANHESWRATERSNLTKTEFYWNVLTKRDPKLLDIPEFVNARVLQTMQSLDNAPAGAGPAVLADYCKQYFQDLGSGVWRARTPQLYKFLDEAPPVPTSAQ